jgi:hypothetical protein
MPWAVPGTTPQSIVDTYSSPRFVTSRHLTPPSAMASWERLLQGETD